MVRRSDGTDESAPFRGKAAGADALPIQPPKGAADSSPSRLAGWDNHSRSTPTAHGVG